MAKKILDETIKTTDGFVEVQYKVGDIIDYNKKKMEVVEVSIDDGSIQVKALEFPFESFPIFTRVKHSD